MVPSPEQTTYRRPTDFSFNGFFQGWFHHLRQPETPVIRDDFQPKAKEANKEAKPERPTTRLWSSESDFRNGFLSDRNVETFLDEYVAMFSKKVYDYSPYGIPEKLPKHLQLLTSEICEAHKQDLIKAGKKTDRADLEIYVAKTLEHWMADPTVPVGAKLVTISPRGTVEEGYPGTKTGNYIFVNVYEKVAPGTNATGFKLNQFTSYDLNHPLRVLQKEFQTVCGATPYNPLEMPFQPTQSSHIIIGNILSIPPEVSLDQLQTLIHHPDREKKWPFKLKDLPELDMTIFQEYRQAVVNLCQHEFEHLLLTQTPEIASRQFDLLIYTIRDWFLKWVEDHAANYKHLNRDITTDFPSPNEMIETIQEEWHLVIAKEAGKKLSEEETERLAALKAAHALNPMGVLVRASTMAHCVVGTPLSAVNKLSEIANFSSLKPQDLLNPSFRLTAEQRAEIKHKLDSMTKIFVENRQTGRVEIFYLEIFDKPNAHFYEKSCYKLESDGVVRGPCIGDDGEGIPLDIDPLVNYANILTEREYLDWRQALLAQDITQEIAKKQDLTPEEELRIRVLVRKLSQKLFKVSVTNLIAGVTEYQFDSIASLPLKYRRALLTSTTPLLTLAELADDLEVKELNDIESTIIFEQPSPDRHQIPETV